MSLQSYKIMSKIKYYNKKNGAKNRSVKNLATLEIKVRNLNQ